MIQMFARPDVAVVLFFLSQSAGSYPVIPNHLLLQSLSRLPYILHIPDEKQDYLVCDCLWKSQSKKFWVLSLD